MAMIIQPYERPGSILNPTILAKGLRDDQVRVNRVMYGVKYLIWIVRCIGDWTYGISCRIVVSCSGLHSILLIKKRCVHRPIASWQSTSPSVTSSQRCLGLLVICRTVANRRKNMRSMMLIWGEANSSVWTVLSVVCSNRQDYSVGTLRNNT